MKKRIVLTTLALIALTTAYAQKLVVKSNLLYDATTTFNLGIEAPLARQWTLDLSANYNPWTFADNRKWKHYLLQPELRYWTRRRFNGHFLGVHTGWGVYNVSHLPLPGVSQAQDYRYEGWITGAGLAYGYAFRLGKRWNLELTAGAGWIYTRYNQFKCEHCGEKVAEQRTASRFAPTKAGISLIYVIGGEPEKNLVQHRETEETLQPQIDRERERQEARRIAQEQEALALQQEQQQVYRQRMQAYTDSVQRAQAYPRRFAIRFATGQARLDLTLAENRQAMEEITALLGGQAEAGAPRKTYSILIAGYASPEGGMQTNERLATQRAKSVRTALKKQLPQLPDSLFSIRCGGEDWEGLRQLVEQDIAMKHRREVLRIIDNVPVNQGRNKQLMDLKGGRPYLYMMDKMFPALRSVSYIYIKEE